MAWDRGTAACKRIQLDPFLTPHTKMNSKQVSGLNLRTKTVKLLKENIGVGICDSRLGNGFLDVIPKAHTVKEKKYFTGHFIKITPFCKRYHQENKKTRIGRKYLQIIHLVRDFYLEYKELKFVIKRHEILNRQRI